MSLFHCNRSGEEDVVLEVNVLMKVGFKVCQGFVQSLEVDAGIARGPITRVGLTHRTQRFACGVVLELRRARR